MKTIYQKYLLPALSGLVLAGCADLDTVPLSTVVTADQKEDVVNADPSKIEASVTAISANFTVFGATSTSYHNDFGYPSIMMATDSRGTDMVGFDTGYNWFSSPLLYTDCSNTNSMTAMQWRTLYNQIFAANAVIGSIDPETEESVSQYYLAQALAVRAFDYFVLVQLYQFNYVGHESSPGVPLITPENKDEAAVNGLARSTVQETYDFILADLEKAISLLQSTSKQRDDKRYVSLDVVYGIRARVYLTMQNWSAALADAEAAISNSNCTPLSFSEAAQPGFIDIEDHEWMWGVLITDKDRVSTTGICNFPSHMGSLNYGYASVGAWRMINKKLYALIPSTDARKGWFLDENKQSANLTAAQLEYLEGASAPAYTQVKYAPKGGVLGTSENDNDVPLMRIEEMYLIKAEAQAMGGNLSGGINTLESFVQTYRNPAYRCNASDATGVQEAIWLQRRIEFWGEGLSWFDIMRLNKGVNRLGCGFPATAVFNIPAGDGTLIFPIPHSEEQYNALIEANPSVSIPTPIPDEE